MRISVVIPLYNKRAEIGQTLRSVFAQTRPADEIIVVDDGSTDDSAEEISGDSRVKIIRQANSGVSVARNRGVAESSGDYIAFLDGDDWWEATYLEVMCSLIESYPSCGAYAAGIMLRSGERGHRLKMPVSEGIVSDFWSAAMQYYILQPSSVVIPRAVLDDVGGFPEGMKIGEDLYEWVRIASKYPVCFTPELLVNYNRTATNRSVSIYNCEQTAFSFEDLYDPAGDAMRNEFIARCAIGKAITLSVKGDSGNARRAERFFRYSRLYRRHWWRLWLLNRLPRRVRPTIHWFYTSLAWLVAKRGM